MSTEDREVPYHCPYCGGEDLWPHEEQHGAWECRGCTRVFAVRLLGLRQRTRPDAPATARGGEE